MVSVGPSFPKSVLKCPHGLVPQALSWTPALAERRCPLQLSSRGWGLGSHGGLCPHLSPTLTSYMALSKLLRLSEPQFPHL